MTKKEKIGLNPLGSDKVYGSVVDKIKVGNDIIKPEKKASDFNDNALKFVSSDESVTIAPTANAGEIDFTVEGGSGTGGVAKINNVSPNSDGAINFSTSISDNILSIVPDPNNHIINLNVPMPVKTINRTKPGPDGDFGINAGANINISQELGQTGITISATGGGGTGGVQTINNVQPNANGNVKFVPASNGVSIATDSENSEVKISFDAVKVINNVMPTTNSGNFSINEGENISISQDTNGITISAYDPLPPEWREVTMTLFDFINMLSGNSLKLAVEQGVTGDSTESVQLNRYADISLYMGYPDDHTTPVIYTDIFLELNWATIAFASTGRTSGGGWQLFRWDGGSESYPPIDIVLNAISGNLKLTGYNVDITLNRNNPKYTFNLSEYVRNVCQAEGFNSATPFQSRRQSVTPYLDYSFAHSLFTSNYIRYSYKI